jgi:glycosyltransferase involved in cell wall biosynthesis/2-polyprenyl-3-methyl-5-hydroxy-6-metoxy-1,4-benzoquinol methylase
LPVATPSDGGAPVLDAALRRLRLLVRDAWVARGADPDCDPAAANIDYNSTDCRRRAAALAAHVERSYGFSLAGKAVCELGAGYGGLCLHFALEHGADRILAVDKEPPHVAALRTVVREFGLDGFTIVKADLRSLRGHDRSMDLVVLNDVLYSAELLPDRIAAVCARLLRPGGIVLFRHVNRTHGPEVASHRDGTQFLDPDSADRAMRFMTGGAGSTLAHRPLSPSGLAALLRQAGFDDLRLDGDNDGGRDTAPGSRGLRSRYLLSGRSAAPGAQSRARIGPPPAGVFDPTPFRDAAARGGAGRRVAAAELCRLFGASLPVATACQELQGYVVDRLIMDGLASFRTDPADRVARGFAEAFARALDHALVAVLSRHAGWKTTDFARAAPEKLREILDRCGDDLRAGFRQPGDRWAASADWDAIAARAVALAVPGKTVGRRARSRAAELLRAILEDRLRLGSVGLLARCADPLTGAAATEYAEAALDCLYGELWDAARPRTRTTRPVCPPALIRLVEEIEAEMARGVGATLPAPDSSGPGAAAAAPASAAQGLIRGRVCILSRKSLRNITRVPRMARALCEAGYAVTVVSLAAPAGELQSMCPAVEYRTVNPRPLTFQLLFRLQHRVERQRRGRRRREDAYRRALARGGLPRILTSLGAGAAFAVRYLLHPLWAAFAAFPAALVLKRADRSLGQAWREFSHMTAFQLVFQYLSLARQLAATRGFAREAEKAVRDRRFDVVQAHDNYALAAAARLAARDKARLIYDAVELTSHRLATNFSRLELMREHYERRREAAIFRGAHAMTTVGEGLADWYSQNYAIPRPVVVKNCRYHWPHQNDGRLRADAGIGPEVRLLVWFGGAYPQQGIELLIRALRLMAPSVHLAIVATVQPRWVPFVEGLPKLAAELGLAGRVHLLPAREPNDLIPYVSGADLGVIPRPSEHPNNFYSMPNKFLEMVMARLPIAVSRVGDMVDAINQHGIGAVFDERDLDNVAAVIEQMLEPETYSRLRANVMQTAEELTWEKESVRYVELVGSLTPPRSADAAADRGAAIRNA